jgi:hypothetical protein
LVMIIRSAYRPPLASPASIFNPNPGGATAIQPVTCPSCEAALEDPDSSRCWNCGAEISADVRVMIRRNQAALKSH